MAPPPPSPQPEPPVAPPRYADPTFLTGPSSGPLERVPDGQLLQPDQTYVLEVAVREKCQGLPSVTKLQAIPPLLNQKPVEIVVTVESLDFDVTEPVATLVLPPSGDSTRQAHFEVKAKAAVAGNLGRLRVRMYYHFNLLEELVVVAEVAEPFADATLSTHGLADPISFTPSRREQEYVDLVNVEPRSMHIDVTREGEHYEFRFLLENAAHQQVTLSAPVRLTVADLETRLSAVRDALQKIAMDPLYGSDANADEHSFRLAMKELALAGRHLHDVVFYSDAGAMAAIGDWLAAHPLPAEGIVQVSLDHEATSFVIPWAVLYDGLVPESSQELAAADWNGFWGLRYCLELLLPKGVEPLTQTVDAESGLKMGFMLWDSFKEAPAEVTMMQTFVDRSQKRLTVTAPITSPSDCRALLTNCDCQLLYFFSHGSSRVSSAGGAEKAFFEHVVRDYEALPADDPRRAAAQLLYSNAHAALAGTVTTHIQLPHGSVELDDLLTIRQIASNPLVFLNMCESACISPSVSEGFIPFFIGHGARAVLGTECLMTQHFAHPFAQEVLRRLLAGERFGQVLLEARRYFLDRQNPLGLAYTLYGPATTCLVPPIIA